MSNSINASRHIINLTQFFFCRSVENFWRIDKLFNITLKIRGHPIIIREITIGIAIIIRGISQKRSRIKITSISIVIKIVSLNKIHIYGITILLNQSRQRHIIKINRSILLATNFIRASTFPLKEFGGYTKSNSDESTTSGGI